MNNNRIKKYPELELLNYEGGVFTIIKVTDDKFVLVDQWKVYLGIYSAQQILNIVERDQPIADSSKKTWVFSKEEKTAQPDKSTLYSFLNSAEVNGEPI